MTNNEMKQKVLRNLMDAEALMYEMSLSAIPNDRKLQFAKFIERLIEIEEFVDKKG